MGKKNKKKSPAAPIYIAPPSENKVEEFTVVDYDPQTQINDPFEDDLDFLLKADQDANIEALETTITTSVEIVNTKNTSNKSISSKRGNSATPEPNDVKITRKVKKEIIDFDITFSSDESEKEEDTGKVVRDVDSERYMRAELGLDSSDNESTSDDDNDEIEKEDFDLMSELYEKLAISGRMDGFQDEQFDEEDMSDFEGYAKVPVKHRFESQNKKKTSHETTQKKDKKPVPKIKAKKQSLLQNTKISDKSSNVSNRETTPDGTVPKRSRDRKNRQPRKENTGKNQDKKEEVEATTKSELLEKNKERDTKGINQKRKKKEEKERVADNSEQSNGKEIKPNKSKNSQKAGAVTNKEEKKNESDVTKPEKDSKKKKNKNKTKKETITDKKGSSSDNKSKPKTEAQAGSTAKIDALQEVINKRMTELNMGKQVSPSNDI